MVVADFGFAIETANLHINQENVGTVLYQPPEQAVPEFYGKPADIWACGFIMYELLSGQHPLWEKDEDDRKSYKGKLKAYVELDLEKPCFSEMARSLLKRLCALKPSKRYKAREALEHPWITREVNASVPLTQVEKELFMFEMDTKLRSVSHVLNFLRRCAPSSSSLHSYRGRSRRGAHPLCPSLWMSTRRGSRMKSLWNRVCPSLSHTQAQ